MKALERSSRPPASPLGHDLLIALTMATALMVLGFTMWIWSGR